MAVSFDFAPHGTMTEDGTYLVHGAIIRQIVKGVTREYDFQIKGETMRMKIGDEYYTLRRAPTEPQHSADGSQPFRPSTNTASGAAGSRR